MSTTYLCLEELAGPHFLEGAKAPDVGRGKAAGATPAGTGGSVRTGKATSLLPEGQRVSGKSAPRWKAGSCVWAISISDRKEEPASCLPAVMNLALPLGKLAVPFFMEGGAARVLCPSSRRHSLFSLLHKKPSSVLATESLHLRPALISLS